MNGGQRAVLGSLAVMVALITIRNVATRPGLPSPRAYLPTGAIFSIWYLLALGSPGLGGTLAVGTVITALLAPYLPGGSGNSPLAQLGNLISGGNAVPAGA